MKKAELALTQAELDLDHATLTAPIDGTVSAQPFTKGESMSTSDAIEIVGAGAIQLSIDVSEDAIGSVKVGQQASVSPSPGTSYSAKVTAISLLPSDSTSSSATYPVTVTIKAATAKKYSATLASGVSATATITVASAEDAVLVPVSAVRPTGDGAGTVTVVAGSKATTQRVQLGVMDATRVQITDGLAAGATVSLADTTEALPTTSTTTSGNRQRSGSSLTGGGGLGSGGSGGGSRRGGG
ncbi:MAG: HlyD family efflux transporter periplasmic adaptor subunit [Microlunatus sp.]